MAGPGLALRVQSRHRHVAGSVCAVVALHERLGSVEGVRIGLSGMCGCSLGRSWGRCELVLAARPLVKLRRAVALYLVPLEICEASRCTSRYIRSIVMRLVAWIGVRSRRCKSHEVRSRANHLLLVVCMLASDNSLGLLPAHRVRKGAQISNIFILHLIHLLQLAAIGNRCVASGAGTTQLILCPRSRLSLLSSSFSKCSSRTVLRSGEQM